jgi:hypothetical protein
VCWHGWLRLCACQGSSRLARGRDLVESSLAVYHGIGMAGRVLSGGERSSSFNQTPMLKISLNAALAGVRFQSRYQHLQYITYIS